MSRFTTMVLLSIAATLLWGDAAAARPVSSPTASPDSTFASQASTQGAVTPSSQPASEGSVPWGLGFKVAAACLLVLAWRSLKNTRAWRDLLVMLGADPAAQPDEGALIGGDPTAGLDLALGPAPAVPETQPAITHLNVSELSGDPDCPPRTIFTREYLWTSTSSSVSTRESHYSQPASTRSA